MKLSSQSDDGDAVSVDVVGRITQDHVSPFSEPLGETLGGYKRRVMLNMKAVEMLDSSGVGWLLVCHRRFKDKGGDLVLHSYQPLVANVLRVLNLQKVLKMAESEDDARRLLEGESS